MSSSASSPAAPAEKPPTTHVYLVRHGTAEGAEGVAVGQIDLPLSERGADDLRRLAESWQGPPPDRLISSDLLRTSQSAETLSEALDWGMSPQTDARLREMDFGAWDGKTWKELRETQGEHLDAWMKSWWDQPAPDGESFDQVADRAREWLDELLVDAAGEVVVVCAHGGSIRTLLGGLLEMPIQKTFHLRLDHGRVSALETTFRGVEVAFVNRLAFHEEHPRK